MAPVGGVYIAEYYIVKKAFKNIEDESSVNPIVTRSIVAWVIGIVITTLSTYGFITLSTISPLDGFITGFIAQAIIGKLSK